MSPGVVNISRFIYDYAGANFAILKIFINYPFYTKMTRDEVTITYYDYNNKKLTIAHLNNIQLHSIIINEHNAVISSLIIKDSL